MASICRIKFSKFEVFAVCWSLWSVYVTNFAHNKEHPVVDFCLKLYILIRRPPSGIKKSFDFLVTKFFDKFLCIFDIMLLSYCQYGVHLPSWIYKCVFLSQGCDYLQYTQCLMRTVPEFTTVFTAVFTARCTLVQSAVLRSHVVCLSVCDVGELWSHRLEFFENNFTIS